MTPRFLPRPNHLAALLAALLALSCGPVAALTSTPAPTQAVQTATQPPAVGTAAPTQAPAEATSAEPGATATTPAEATAPAEIVVERTAVFGSGTFNLPDPRVGLAALSGYSTTLTIT